MLLATCWCNHKCVKVLHTMGKSWREKMGGKKLSYHNINCSFRNLYGGRSIGASWTPEKHISGKWWTLSQYLQKNTWLIILLEGVCASFCFARCVLYTMFLLYLAHLSACHHLRVSVHRLFMFTGDPVAKRWALSSHKLLGLWIEARWKENTFLF